MITDSKKNKITSLIEFAKDNNRFYSDFYKDYDLSSEDLSCLPVLERRFIREHSEEIISNGYCKDNLKHDHTNGTTEGKPLDIYKTDTEWIALDLDLWKTRRRINKKASEKYAFYYFNGNDYSEPYRLRVHGNRTTLQLPMRKKDEKDFLEDLKMMDEQKIKWIIAPPSIIFSLCCIAIKYNFEINIEVIETISEYLPKIYKHFFESVLGGKVYVHYSCHEIWGMAFSDQSGKFKIMDECFLQVKRDDRFHSGYGRCIATNLRIKSMPFINYELSDLVVIEDDYVKTYGFRWTEKVKLKCGTIHCSFFDNIFLEYKDEVLLPLENYQIVYNEDKIFIYLIGKNEEKCEKISQYVSKKLKESFDFEVDVECISTSRFFVDSISGKMRGIISYDDVNWNGWEFHLINKISQRYLDDNVIKM